MVDRTVIDFVNSGDVDISDFHTNDGGAVYMSRDLTRQLTARFSDIIVRNERYFVGSGDRKSYGFQVMLDLKLEQLTKAIERRDVHAYAPYIWKIPHEQ